MFQVTDGEMTYDVYAVNKISYGLTEFLIYDGKWKWVYADKVKPVNEVNEDISGKLLGFIKESSGYWDINYTDVRDWIMFNKDKLIEIIK